MKKMLIPVIASLFFIGNVSSEEPKIKVPVVKIKECASPPSINGTLDDECWKSAYQSPTFYNFKLKQTDFKPNKDTTLFVTADKQYLYIGVECKHPTPKDMSVEKKENFSRIFGDESVKFFINPGIKENKFFRFVVNPNNAQTFNGSSFVPSSPWPTATRITEDGWNLEVAIPLFYLASYGDIKKLKMNVYRKKILKDYDNQGVQVGKFEEISSWCPTDVWISPEKMGKIEDIGKDGLTVPFLATADGIQIHRFRYAKDRPYYDISMELKSLTNTPGKAEVIIDETTSSGKQNKLKKEYELKGKELKVIKIEIPIEKLEQRKVKVEIRNAATGMLMATLPIHDTSVLDMLSGYSKLNYYTSEKNAQIIFVLGLPEEELKDKTIQVASTNGTLLSSLKSPLAKGILLLPVNKLQKGTNQLKLVLADSKGKKLFSEKVDIVRLDPKPNCEIKIDREYGFFIKNGKPFFPYGFCSEIYDHALKEISGAGFNTVIYWTGGTKNMKDAVEKVGKYGLNVVIRAHSLEKYHPEKLKTIKKYIDPKDYKKAYFQCRAPLRIKLMNDGVFSKFTRKQRNELGKEYFDFHIPEIVKNVEAIKDLPNLLGYKTVDEPIFLYWDLHKELMKMYLAEKKADPYHPMFILYSSRIPTEPHATSCADCIGTDPYWTPGRIAQRGTVDWVSMITARTVKRARQDHMVPWTVPQDSWWSNCTKRALNGKEQICQSYITLIHGSKCVLYWVYSLIAHVEQWKALQEMAKRYKVLGPAIAAPDVPQKQVYSSGVCDPVKGVLPEVQVKLMKLPDGPYVLLAANSKYYAVDTKITIEGIKDTTVKRLFSDKTYKVNDNAFNDKFEGMGVRAYSIEEIACEGPIKISIDMTPHKGNWKLVKAWDYHGRIGMKNIMPNPSFEEDTLPNWPDYIFPASRPRDGGHPRIGTPEANFTLTTENPYHGKKCLFSDQRNFYLKFGPKINSAQDYTVSFYARTNSEKPVKIKAFTLGGGGKRQYLLYTVAGKKWKRYSATFKVPPKLEALLYFLVKEGAVYIDAMQIEKGLKATEFQP